MKTSSRSLQISIFEQRMYRYNIFQMFSIPENYSIQIQPVVKNGICNSLFITENILNTENVYITKSDQEKEKHLGYQQNITWPGL